MSLVGLKIRKQSENFAFAVQFVDNNKGNLELSLGVQSAFKFGPNGEK